MSSHDIVLSWKSPEHRHERPAHDHPAGEILLDPLGGSDYPPAGDTLTWITCGYTCGYICPTFWGMTCGADTFACCAIY